MKASAELQKMNACTDALDWIGNRTIGQAWRDCRRSDWMLWLLRRIAPNDHRCRLAAADFEERVWHLIDNEPARLAAAWAIGAARRGNADEMMAAASYSATSYAAAAAANSAANSANSAATNSAANSANSAAAANSAATNSAAAAAERAAQADILRGYFSASEVAKLFSAITKEGER